MQALAPPAGDRNPAGHTAAEVRDALTGRYGPRRFGFRYERLDAGNTVLASAIEGVETAKVTNNWLADIKRKAEFRIRDLGQIDYLSERIRPLVRLYLAPFGVNDWVEWPQGVFLLSTPKRHADAAGVVTRDVSGYDQLQVYSDDLIDARYTAAAGAVYTTLVSTLLGSISKNVVASAATLLTAREWEPGTSKLRIINDLLSSINYDSLSFDEEGVAQVRPYRDLATQPEEWTYDAGELGLIVPEVDEDVDLFDVPNRWVLVVSDPDRPALRATYTNADPASLTSTVRRQRTITDFRTEQDAPDQATLDAKARRLALEASQVYQAVSFTTGLMPIHGSRDTYRIVYPDLGVNVKFAEHEWSMTLDPVRVGQMTHVARRVVTLP